MRKRELVKNIQTRRKVTTWINNSLYEDIRRAARDRNLSQQNVLEGALRLVFSSEEFAEKENRLDRKLDRLDQKLKELERKIEIGAEINVLLFRNFTALTHAIPEEKKELLEAKAQARVDAYLDGLAFDLQKKPAALERLFKKSF